MPERFLDLTGKLDVHEQDPADVAFGFGRRRVALLRYASHILIASSGPLFRVCPGRHFAESTLFILCASMLSAFEIGPPLNEDGTLVELKREATDNCLVS